MLAGDIPVYDPAIRRAAPQRIDLFAVNPVTDENLVAWLRQRRRALNMPKRIRLCPPAIVLRSGRNIINRCLSPPAIQIFE